VDDTISGAMGLEFVPGTKFLHSQWRSGFEVFGHCLYEWKGDHFERIAFAESHSWQGVHNERKVDGKTETYDEPGVEDWFNIPHEAGNCDLIPR
jgi:hypothetical protein